MKGGALWRFPICYLSEQQVSHSVGTARALSDNFTSYANSGDTRLPVDYTNIRL